MTDAPHPPGFEHVLAELSRPGVETGADYTPPEPATLTRTYPMTERARDHLAALLPLLGATPAGVVEVHLHPDRVDVVTLNPDALRTALATCLVCGTQLTDHTGGATLTHHDDGSHTYTPGPAPS